MKGGIAIFIAILSALLICTSRASTIGTNCQPYIVVVYPTDGTVTGTEQTFLLNAIDDQIIDRFSGTNTNVGLVSYNLNTTIESGYVDLSVGGNDAILSSFLFGTTFTATLGSDWTTALSTTGNIINFAPVPDFVVFIASDHATNLATAIGAANALKANGAQMLAIGVEALVTAGELQSISGPQLNVDYAQAANYQALDATLDLIVSNAICCDGIRSNCGICNATNACDDGNSCTTNDQCNVNGDCVGVQIICPITDNNSCTQDQCISGVCQNVVLTGQSCSDGSICTINDQCNSFGQCAGVILQCDDGIFCNGLETCQENPNAPGQPICVAGSFPDCSDGLNCTQDICNFNTSTCSNPPLAQIGTPCGVTDCGICQLGVTICTEQGGLACFGNIDPQPEDCGPDGFGNGIDENCNDMVDEGCGFPCILPSDCPSRDCFDITCLNQVCEYNPSDDGTLCDDGFVCTVNDTCTAGECSGVVSCSDQNACTQDLCSVADGTCLNLFQSGPCDDGNACTFNDLCQINGTVIFCLGTPITCADCSQCTADTCNTITGQCVFTNLVDGSACDDADACSLTETCQSGECVPQTLFNCNDSNLCTNDTCLDVQGDATCFYTFNDGLVCNDVNACTSNDVCFRGACGGTTINCNDNITCTIDGCNPLTGCTFNSTMAIGNDCDDADLCTQNDTCIVGGICSGDPVSCNDDNACTIDSCTDNDCVFLPQTGTPCDDGNPCTITDTCVQGECIGTFLNCNDTNPCTTDACINGTCLHFANTNPCNDLNACTTNDICSDTICSGTLINCNDTIQCTLDGCSPATGCTHLNITGGTCDDGDECTLNDVCVAGACVGTPMNCADQNICTDDFCLNGLCVYSFNTLPCSDGDSCTNDTCSAGTCLPGPPLNCSDGNVCTLDFCDPILGLCQHQPLLVPNATVCDDLNRCTANDRCTALGGCAGTPIICDDGNPCTTDACVDGCCHFTPQNGTVGAPLCSDANACTTLDACFNGVCTGVPIICDDGNACTSGFCVDGICRYINNDTLICDDLNPCTVNDTCVQGQCTGVFLTCNDNNACTLDGCNPLTGACVNTPVISSCDDSNACTINDMCLLNGTCMGVPIVCDDGNQCTEDICCMGVCYQTGLNTTCDDLNPCTLNDVCNATTRQCQGTPIVCNDLNPCTVDTCAAGLCVFTAQPIGTSCDDGDPCTDPDTCTQPVPNVGLCVGTPIDCDDGLFCNGVETCLNGLCQPGTPPTCSDGNLCTFDQCIFAQNQCVNDPIPCIGEPCGETDVGICAFGSITCNATTGEFSCVGAIGPQPTENCNNTLDDNCNGVVNDGCGNACVTVQDCPTMLPCLSVACVGTMCVYTPIASVPCDDLDACTLVDLCVNGTCQGTPINCTDQNVCTNDICVNGMCAYTYNTLPCDDQNACTLSDHCVQGVCTGTPSNCDDLNACTDDFCNTQTGICFHGSNSDPCDDLNPCTVGDICQCDGTCLGLSIFCDDSNVCTTDSCNPITGTCVFTFNQNPCDDLNACTTLDTCSILNGTCAGVPINCDDLNICTTDGCTAGVCTHTNARTLCDDGNPCTANDICDVVTGLCVGIPLFCDDQNPCTTDSCDQTSGLCMNQFNTDCCQDGNPCTVEDRCNGAGLCVGVPMSCSDGNFCTDDVCSAGVCINSFNSSPCDDSDPCTTGDTCVNGTCVGLAANCDDLNQCTLDQCNPLTGACTFTVISGPSPCSDGDPCTVSDQCINGVCQGVEINCDDQNTCSNDICLLGECFYTFLNATLCNDGNACTTADTCVLGRCVGTPTVCDDLNPCTEDFCDVNGACVFQACLSIQVPCDDGNACTQNDRCFNGTCIGTPVQCSDGNFCNGLETCNAISGACQPGVPPNCTDAFACTLNICDNQLGVCTNPPNPANGTQCGSNTNVGVCNMGVLICQEPSGNLTCVGSISPSPEVCNDGLDNDCDGLVDEGCGSVCATTTDCPLILCSTAFCNLTTNLCQYTDNTLPCDDGDLCTRNDQCNGGLCAGIPLDCNDFEFCTQDSCNATTGFCEHTPLSVNVPCSDGNACTTSDHCFNSTCVGVPFVCNDNQECTEDVCVDISGQPLCFTMNLNGTVCDDNNPCTLNDVCLDGVCASDPIQCNDQNPCTNDLCSGGVCVFSNNTLPCNDLNPCTTLDTCLLGVCSGSPIPCSDSNPCTNDSCEAGLCVNTPNTLPCDDLNPCTLNDTCSAGICSGILRNCTDGNVCTFDSCDQQAGGICVHTNTPGVLCDDLNLCTQNDTCNAGGVCVGAPIICNDFNICTDDQCMCGVCVFVPNELPCSDGNPCTVQDQCFQSLCLGDPLDCDDGDVCTADSCVLPGGVCQHLEISNFPCDDLNACTQNDICQDGVCVGTPQNCNDGNPCTADVCLAGVCSHPPSATVNGTIPCNDLNQCTINDFCTTLGGCIGTPLDCNTGDPCITGTCNAQTGLCDAANTNALCDDLNSCTLNDRCLAGQCVGTPVVCDNCNPCTTDTCNPLTGICEHTNNLLECDDQNPCTVQDMCVQGVCMGMPNSCSDDNSCTDDSCDKFTGLCVHVNNNDNPCKHPNPCIIEEFCSAGQCIGTPKNCSDCNPCTGNVCDPLTGQCVVTNNSLECDDADLCTFNDQCVNGTCVGTLISCEDPQGPNPCTNDFCYRGQCFHVPNGGVCTDGNPCTTDVCDLITGQCVSTNNSLPCNDGNLCTSGDVCGNGTCSGTPINCSDGNQCTADTCNVQTGTCINTPLQVGSVCSDGNLCTINDACNAQVVCAGVPLNCDDGNPCTGNQCNPQTGLCVASNNNGPCQDGDLCTLGDVCVLGECVGTPVDCGANTQCTNHTCLSGICITSFLVAECDDGDLCTNADQCVNGQCVGTPLNCTDSNPCTGNTCNPQTGLCVTTNNQLPCDDGNLCTVGDHCLNGACIGSRIQCNPSLNPCENITCNPINGQCESLECLDITCDDGDLCTTGDRCINKHCEGIPVACPITPCSPGQCNPLTGNCVQFPVGTPCTDLNACTLLDTCQLNGNCTGLPTNCNDSNPCTDDVCVDLGGDAECFHKDNTNLCDDENACTTLDHCLGGECIGTLADCDDGNECTNDYCDRDTGECVQNFNWAYCDDGDSCTSHDQCSHGECQGTPIVCMNGGNTCVESVCIAGRCIPTYLPNGQPCDIPANLCIVNSTCQDGICKNGTPVNCNDDNPCTTDRCDHTTGLCEIITLPSGCDDGDLCTVNDFCNTTTGVCSGTEILCVDQDPCTIDECSPINGQCSFTPSPNGYPCDDGQGCTVGDSCHNGICTPGTLKVCHANGCLAPMCNFTLGDCQPINVGQPCNDNNPCTVHDLCSIDGECLGFDRPCCDRNNCTIDYCDPQTGECLHTFALAGTTCSPESIRETRGNNNDDDDHDHGDDDDDDDDDDNHDNGDCDLCIAEHQCNGLGTCVGRPVICENDNICVQSHCNHATGECVFVNLQGSCDDCDSCTFDDTCTLVNGTVSVCIGTRIDCSDDNPCTRDTCAGGRCFYKDLTGIVCDDHSVCTSNDTCLNGVCTGTLLTQCGDGTPCSTHMCDPLTGRCIVSPPERPCDDQNPCTTSDYCDSHGRCQGIPKVCDDNNDCTTDSCDPYLPCGDSIGGCVHEPHNGKCYLRHGDDNDNDNDNAKGHIHDRPLTHGICSYGKCVPDRNQHTTTSSSSSSSTTDDDPGHHTTHDGGDGDDCDDDGGGGSFPLWLIIVLIVVVILICIIAGILIAVCCRKSSVSCAPNPDCEGMIRSPTLDRQQECVPLVPQCDTSTAGFNFVAPPVVPAGNDTQPQHRNRRHHRKHAPTTVPEQSTT